MLPQAVVVVVGCHEAGPPPCWWPGLLRWALQMIPACLNVRMEKQFVPVEANVNCDKAKVRECCSR